jgi:hypothetical protein
MNTAAVSAAVIPPRPAWRSLVPSSILLHALSLRQLIRRSAG